MSREVMQIAYDALTTVHRGDFEGDCEFSYEKCWKAIKALKTELDKPEPKLILVDYFHTIWPDDDSSWEQDNDRDFESSIPLYRLEK
jgi:hypothetical protein